MHTRQLLLTAVVLAGCRDAVEPKGAPYLRIWVRPRNTRSWISDHWEETRVRPGRSMRGLRS